MSSDSPKLSIADLEQLLDGKRNSLVSLVQRREKIAIQIADLDSEIQQLCSLRGILGRPRKKRMTNVSPLRTVLLEVLKKNKKGLKLADLAAKITEAGYRTQSARFSNVVYQTIYHTPEVELDEKTGCYRLKK